MSSNADAVTPIELSGSESDSDSSVSQVSPERLGELVKYAVAKHPWPPTGKKNHVHKGRTNVSKFTSPARTIPLSQKKKKKTKQQQFSMKLINKDKGSSHPPSYSLYKPVGIINKVNWSCIVCVADEKKVENGDISKVPRNKQSQQLAKGAYCTLCKEKIYFTASSHKNIAKHMQQKHPHLLKKKEETKPVNLFYSTANVKLGKISKVDQLRGEVLVAKHLCDDLRPMNLVESGSFRDMIHFFNCLSTEWKAIGRTCVGKRISDYAKLVRLEMKKIIKHRADFYALTTDIWTSCQQESFMALTYHALTIDFEFINLTLDMEPIPERHTGENIKNKLLSRFEYWELVIEKLTLMMRDAASNGKKAMSLLGIPSEDCITHGNHLVVGPLFFTAPKKRNRGNVVSGADDDSDDEDEDEVDDIADYTLDEIEAAMDELDDVYRGVLKHITKKVNDIRKIVRYIKKSPNATRKFDEFQRVASPNAQPVSLLLDVRTRWSSTEIMISRFVRLKEAISMFISYLKTPQGKKEFNRKVLPTITDADWAYFEAVIILLKPFSRAIKHLCGEKYPTFIFALPTLRSIESFLSNPGLFSKTNQKSYIKLFYENYSDAEGFKKVIDNVDIVRSGLLLSFQKRFKMLRGNFMWTTYLDPRFRRSMDHLTEEEKPVALKDFINEVATVIKNKSLNVEVVQEEIELDNDSDDEDEDEDEDEYNYIDKQCTQPSSQPSIQSADSDDADKNAEAQAVDAVTKYINTTISVKSKQGPIEWWRQHKEEFPYIAVLARKWLAVPASSTPSERAFSDCGIAQAGKRNRLGGTMLKDQIIVRRNKEQINISTETLVQHFMKKNSDE